MDEKINNLMALNDKVNEQHFIGDTVGMGMISNMMERMTFLMDFLMSKDEKKNIGEIGIAYVHCPFDNDNRKVVASHIVGGFRVPVKLPFREKNRHKIPLCSPSAADYLLRQW